MQLYRKVHHHVCVIMAFFSACVCMDGMQVALLHSALIVSTGITPKLLPACTMPAPGRTARLTSCPAQARMPSLGQWQGPAMSDPCYIFLPGLYAVAQSPPCLLYFLLCRHACMLSSHTSALSLHDAHDMYLAERPQVLRAQALH